MKQNDFEVVATALAEEGTVWMIPHYLRCPTCNSQVSIGIFLENELIVCRNNHKHSRKDFGKQFGVIRNVSTK